MEREIMNSQEVIKNSIFKQATYSNIFKYDRYDNEIEKCKGNKVLKTETLCDCKIALPLLEEDDQFYIEEIDLVVQIASVIRTSKDNVLYIVYPKYEDDTEEEMEKSYKEAEQIMQRRLDEKQENNKKKYLKESFTYRLFHKFENYDWVNR